MSESLNGSVASLKQQMFNFSIHFQSQKRITSVLAVIFYFMLLPCTNWPTNIFNSEEITINIFLLEQNIRFRY